MARIGGKQVHRQALAGINNDDGPALFGDLLNGVRGVLARHQQEQIIPLDALAQVRAQAGEAVFKVFLGQDPNSPHPDRRSAYMTGYETMPLAPYPRLLNSRLAQVAAGITQSHYLYLRRTLPDDIFAWLQSGLVREQVWGTPPNPFVGYEPAHTWVDPRGYRLSDRIWQTAQSTRDKLDRYLSIHIGEGKSVEAMARDLEVFLLPGRKLRRTRMPYGRDASFDAMRLARTEVTRAHAQASFSAARANPFVDGMDWALSNRHPEHDICDTLATIGMNGERLKEPYPLDTAPVVVVDSHPQCICSNLPAVSATPTQVIAGLREAMARGEPAPPTPAAPRPFLTGLLGTYLAGEAMGHLSDVLARAA